MKKYIVECRDSDGTLHQYVVYAPSPAQAEFKAADMYGRNRQYKAEEAL